MDAYVTAMCFQGPDKLLLMIIALLNFVSTAIRLLSPIRCLGKKAHFINL